MMRTAFSEKLSDPVGLANIQLTDYYNRGLIVTRVYVPAEHRKKGIASRLMKEMCAEADLTKTTLWLEILASGDMNYDALEYWYCSRFGFRGNMIYCRRPR